MTNKIETIYHTLNPHCNGGEALVVEFDLFNNGNRDISATMNITMNSYGLSSTMTLGSMTPMKLRELAYTLENAIKLRS
jgi:hypothetical protein